jgi:hypothetical protein
MEERVHGAMNGISRASTLSTEENVRVVEPGANCEVPCPESTGSIAKVLEYLMRKSKNLLLSAKKII